MGERRAQVLIWGLIALALFLLPGGCRAIAAYEPGAGFVSPRQDASTRDRGIVDDRSLPLEDGRRDQAGEPSPDLSSERTSLLDGSKTRDRGVDLQASETWETVFSLRPGGKTVVCPKSWFLNVVKAAGISGCTGVNNSVLAGLGGKGFDKSLSIPLTRAYQKVRVWIRGYQYGSPDAFNVGDAKETNFGLDKIYVDGVSITRSPHQTSSNRSHVFTFAAGLYRTKASDSSCPSEKGKKPPPFLGQAWVCDSGNRSSNYPLIWYPHTALWSEGQASGAGKNDFTLVPGGLGFYTIDLGKKVTDNLQVHLMQDDSNEFILLTDLEIAVR